MFDGESDEVVCTVKEDKLDLKVFRAFNLQAQNQPDYKTKTNNMSLCMPWSLVILHGKEPLAEVCVQKPFVHQTLCFATQEPKWWILNLGHKTKLVAKAHSKVETHQVADVIYIYIYSITPGSGFETPGNPRLVDNKQQ